MNTCEHHYNCVVVYLAKNCPFCDTESELEQATETIDELRKDLAGADI